MRAVFAAVAVLVVIAGCSDSPAPQPPKKTGSVLPAAPKDKDAPVDDPLPSQSEGQALAAIDAAIKAHGGANALAKAASFERKTKGTNYDGGLELPFTAEASYELPERYHDAVALERADTKIELTLVVDKDRGWQVLDGAVSEMPRERLTDLRNTLHLMSAMTLLPLKERDFILVLLKDEEVEGKPATVVRAAKKEHPDLRLYFDKSSGLLVKTVMRTALAGVQTNFETHLSDYKEVDGVMVAQHQVEYRKGLKVIDLKVESMRLGRKFNGALFGRP